MTAITSIFDLNHISNKLPADEIDELKEYYATYHRKRWAYQKAFKKYKLLKFIENAV